MYTYGVDQSLSNNALYEHKYLGKIRNLYKSSGERDNQQQYKAIIESEIVSNIE